MVLAKNLGSRSNTNQVAKGAANSTRRGAERAEPIV